MNGRFGIPREMRLRSRKDIEAVYRQGQYHHLGMLHAKTLRTEVDTPRFLISVKKKIGSAPERNRIRRVVREAIRLNQSRLCASYDICLFLTQRPQPPPRLATVEPEILKLFERLERTPERRILP